MINKIKFIKDITRINCPLRDVKIWFEGECEGLKKWIGFGFDNHLFVSECKKVTLYCDEKECDKFYSVLEERLGGELFNEMCDCYCELIEKAKLVNGWRLRELLVEIWPILCIFQEGSLYPEFVDDFDLRRLMRIRENTESFVYELFGKLEKEEEPEKYYFFQGDVVEGELDLGGLDVE